MRRIHSDGATEPHGHYVQAIEHQGTVFVSGLLGNSRDEHRAVDRDIETQASHCLDQLEAILAAAGSRLDHVLKLNLFVAAIEQWPRVDALCARRFGDHRPARIVVPCGQMRYGSAIEIDAVAAVVEG